MRSPINSGLIYWVCFEVELELKISHRFYASEVAGFFSEGNQTGFRMLSDESFFHGDTSSLPFLMYFWKRKARTAWLLEPLFS